MDSKDVSRKIKDRIWPLLQSAGFSEFSSRTAWRYSDNRIEVVNFQAMGAYLSQVVGCTPHSFGINVGVYFTFIPATSEVKPVKVRDGRLFPEEWHSHLRARLHADFPQPSLPSRNDIIFIDSGGNLLESSMQQVTRIVHDRAIPWFQPFSDLNAVLRLLQEGIEHDSTVWGFGSNPSPIRSYYIGYTALRLGLLEVARVALTKAYETRAFAHLSEKIQADIVNAV